MNAVIHTEGLTKAYGRGPNAPRALDDLTLSVQPGEVFGYLGPNGAGKTTTLRMLLDLIRPDAGVAQLFGQDVRAHSVAVRRRVGYLPGELNLWKGYVARDVIAYFGRLHGLRDLRYAHALAERLALDTTKRVRAFSTGNRRKLGLVLAMMHQPELLILDEPSSGLDPLMQQTFNALVREARAAGRTVFLSSHVLGEVQAICDRVAILRGGRLQQVARVDDLTRVSLRRVRVDYAATPDLAQLHGQSGVSQLVAQGASVTLHAQGDLDAALRAVLAAGHVADIHVEEPSLEDVFLAYYQDDRVVAGRTPAREML